MVMRSSLLATWRRILLSNVRISTVGCSRQWDTVLSLPMPNAQAHRPSHSFSMILTGLPLLRAYTSGVAISNKLSYTQSSGDEVEDLYRLLRYAQSQFPDLEGVCSGAIASDYQRLRVESVCARLELVSLAPLWRQPQMELFEEMIKNGIEAIIVKVAAEGLIPKRHLGRSLTEMKEHLVSLRDKYGCHVCGEGGEYETLVLDAPSFKFAKIVIDRSAVVQEGNVVPIGILEIQSHHIEAKGMHEHTLSMEPIIVPSGQIENENHLPEMPFDADTGQLEDVEVTISEAGSVYDVAVCLHRDVPQNRYSPEACLELLMRKLKMSLSTGDSSVSFTDVVFVKLFLKDMKAFGDINVVYRRYLPMADPPSRCCVELNIQHPCCLQICVLKDRVPSWSRRILHVQSISSWAPCCIGPYSQATSIDGITFIAGQLGLDPITMQFTESNWKWEVANVLHHCQSVAVAIGGDVQQSAMKITVYLLADFVSTLSEADRHVLQGMMEHDWPLWHSTEPATNEHDDAITDMYLKVPQMDVAIQPVITFVIVSALPKAAKIEIQPVVMNNSTQGIDRPVPELLESTVTDIDFSVISARIPGSKNKNSSSVQCLSVASVDDVLGSIVNAKIVYRHSGFGFIQMHLSKDNHDRWTSLEDVQEFGRCFGRCLCFCLHYCHLRMLSAEVWFNDAILNHKNCRLFVDRMMEEVSSKDGEEKHGSCLPSEGVGIDPWLRNVVVIEVMAIFDYS